MSSTQKFILLMTAILCLTAICFQVLEVIGKRRGK